MQRAPENPRHRAVTRPTDSEALAMGREGKLRRAKKGAARAGYIGVCF